jgi:hypothetical protein
MPRINLTDEVINTPIGSSEIESDIPIEYYLDYDDPSLVPYAPPHVASHFSAIEINPSFKAIPHIPLPPMTLSLADLSNPGYIPPVPGIPLDFDDSLIELDDADMLFHTELDYPIRQIKYWVATETPELRATRQSRFDFIKNEKEKQVFKEIEEIILSFQKRSPKLYLNLESPIGLTNIYGKTIREEDFPHVSKMKQKNGKWEKNKTYLSPVEKIYLIKGLAGTGKSTTALSYLRNPLVITKTNNLQNKYIKMGLEATTSASFLRIYPVHTPFYELKPHYRGSDRDTGIEVKDVGYMSMTLTSHTFIYELTGDKRYLEFHRILPVSMMKDYLRPYYNKVSAFKQRRDVSLSEKITQDLLFDEFGLLGEEDVRCWKNVFEAGAIWSKNIAFTFDENQLNYAGLEFINYIKEHYADRVEEIICYKEWRFEESPYRWWWFDRLYSIPIICDFDQADNTMFISHSENYLRKARNTGGWPKKLSINVDNVQGREYDAIVVGLLGLAALYRYKIPGYKERIYTTVTRGKNFIFYVPRGTSRKKINAAISDVITVLSEVERTMPIYDSSVLNLKTPKNSKSCFFHNFKRSRLRYLRLCHAAEGGTAVFNNKSENKKRNTRTGSVSYRPARFWPEKPRKTALARLFFLFQMYFC